MLLHAILFLCLALADPLDDLLKTTYPDLLLSQSPRALLRVTSEHLKRHEMPTDTSSLEKAMQRVYRYMCEIQVVENECVGYRDRHAFATLDFIRKSKLDVVKARSLGKLDALIRDSLMKAVKRAGSPSCQKSIVKRVEQLLDLQEDEKETLVERIRVESQARDAKAGKMKATEAITQVLNQHEDLKHVAHQAETILRAAGRMAEIARLEKKPQFMELVATVIGMRPDLPMDYILETGHLLQKNLREEKEKDENLRRAIQQVNEGVQNELANKEELMMAMRSKDAHELIRSVINRQPAGLAEGLRAHIEEIREMVMAGEEGAFERDAQRRATEVLEHIGRWSWLTPEEQLDQISYIIGTGEVVAEYRERLRVRISAILSETHQEPVDFGLEEHRQIDQMVKQAYDTWSETQGFLSLGLWEQDRLLEERLVLQQANTAAGRRQLMIKFGRSLLRRMLRRRFEMLRACDGKDESAVLLPRLIPMAAGQAEAPADHVAMHTSSRPADLVSKLLAFAKPDLSTACQEKLAGYLISSVREGIFQLSSVQDPVPMLESVIRDAEEVLLDLRNPRKGNLIDKIDLLLEENYGEKALGHRRLIKQHALNKLFEEAKRK